MGPIRARRSDARLIDWEIADSWFGIAGYRRPPLFREDEDVCIASTLRIQRNPYGVIRNPARAGSVQSTMRVSEICKDGLSIRLIAENENLYVQIVPHEEPPDSRMGLVHCDPDVLASVMRGLTYQLASEVGYVMIRRVGPNVIIEMQAASERQHCILTAEQFAKLVAPVVPPRLRAMLL